MKELIVKSLANIKLGFGVLLDWPICQTKSTLFGEVSKLEGCVGE